MKRLHLFEFHELDRFPTVLRDQVTDFLSSFVLFLNPYRVISERLARAVERSGATCIVDLCSGGAQPILTVKKELDRKGKSIPIIISDKFPNKKAFTAVEEKFSKDVSAIHGSVDATDVPAKLSGFRTIFTAFHHFKEEDAQQILADAVRKNQGIGIFEYTERSIAWAFYALNIPWVVLLINLFSKPFTWQRFAFTYIIPILPFLVFFDGAVSCLRTYSPRQLEELIQSIDLATTSTDYEWEIGQLRTIGILKVTYLIGWPKHPT